MMNYVDICPPAVVYQIQQADLRLAESSTLIAWVEQNSKWPCALAVLEAVALRLKADSNVAVINDFCNTVANYAGTLDADQKTTIREAYLRFPYSPSISFNYFLGLREARLDLRDHLQGRIALDWTFASPRRDAQTWDYYLYLATLEEPGALEALARKIAETKSGNDVTLLLMSLAEVPGKGVDTILKLYADDPRTADGVEGPGMPIGQNVGLLLQKRGTN
jgi:hypothetical protein